MSEEKLITLDQLQTSAQYSKDYTDSFYGAIDNRLTNLEIRSPVLTCYLQLNNGEYEGAFDSPLKQVIGLGLAVCKVRYTYYDTTAETEISTTYLDGQLTLTGDIIEFTTDINIQLSFIDNASNLIILSGTWDLTLDPDGENVILSENKRIPLDLTDASEVAM